MPALEVMVVVMVAAMVDTAGVMVVDMVASVAAMVECMAELLSIV
ncbi:hypothetical protein Pcinc_011172, partial [Petrolisthes cinctipes]